MAQSEMIQSRLQLFFNVGTNEETGDVITKTKSFSNIKPEATTEDLMNVAGILSSLQQHPLAEIRRNDVSLLQAS